MPLRTLLLACACACACAALADVALPLEIVKRGPTEELLRTKVQRDFRPPTIQ